MPTVTADPTPGLRERKKRQTREAISAAATMLFIQAGFEATTIAEVAEVAGVSKMTVTNYFPLKEDLVFDRSAEIVQTPIRALDDRPAGTSVLAALREAYLALIDRHDPTMGVVGAGFTQMVLASPALRSRALSMSAERQTALAERLIVELDDDADPIAAPLAAAQLDAIVRVVAQEGNRRLLLGESPETIAAALRPLAEDAFTRIAAALPAELVRADPTSGSADPAA